MKTSTKLLAALLLLLTGGAYYNLNQLLNKYTIEPEISQSVDEGELRIGSFNHIKVSGLHADQQLNIYYKRDYKLSLSAKELKDRGVFIDLKADTLLVVFQTAKITGNLAQSDIWVFCPHLKSVTVENARCDIHDFRQDSLTVKALGKSKLFMDADTLKWLDVKAKDEAIVGIFGRTKLNKTILNFKNQSQFWAHHVALDSARSHFSDEVKLDLKGASWSLVNR